MPELNEVVGHLKLSDETKTKFEAGEIADLSILFEEHNTNYAAAFVEAKLNDPEFIKPFKDQGYKEAEGKLKGTWENQWGQFFPDIPVKDEQGIRPVKDLLSDVQKVMESKAKPDEKLQEMQSKLIQANKALESLQGQIEAEEHPKIAALKSELEQVKTERENERRLVMLKSLAPDKTTIPLDDWAFLFNRKLEERSLIPTRNESGGLEFKTKDGLYPQNESGTEVIKDPRIIADMLMGYATQKSNGTPTPPQPVNPNDPKVKISPNSHLDRVQQKLKAQAERYGVQQ